MSIYTSFPAPSVSVLTGNIREKVFPFVEGGFIGVVYTRDNNISIAVSIDKGLTYTDLGTVLASAQQLQDPAIIKLNGKYLLYVEVDDDHIDVYESAWLTGWVYKSTIANSASPCPRIMSNGVVELLYEATNPFSSIYRIVSVNGIDNWSAPELTYQSPAFPGPGEVGITVPDSWIFDSIEGKHRAYFHENEGACWTSKTALAQPTSLAAPWTAIESITSLTSPSVIEIEGEVIGYFWDDPGCNSGSADMVRRFGGGVSPPSGNLIYSVGAKTFNGTSDFIDTGIGALPAFTFFGKAVQSPIAMGNGAAMGHVYGDELGGFAWLHPSAGFRGGFIKTGSTWYGAPVSPSLSANTPYDIALTYDGDILKVYIDGVLNASNSGPTGTPPTQTHNIQLGRHPKTFTYWQGQFDKFEIYDYAMNAGQVAGLA